MIVAAPAFVFDARSKAIDCSKESATMSGLPTATLVRDHLCHRTGDTVDFIIDESGGVHVRAADVDVSDLKGLLRAPGRKPVSLEEMDAAIARGRRRTG